MFEKITSFVRRKILRDPQARWNHQYAKGQWDGLRDAREFERQRACRNLFLKYKKGGSLVEFGCGEGILIEHIFQNADYNRYLGLDISDLAIQKAQGLANEKTGFFIANMDTDVISEKFDVIFFNESINYSVNIPRLLENCLKNTLGTEGYFLISVHQFKHADNIWQQILTRLKVVEEIEVQNGRSLWKIKVLQPI